MKATPPKLPEGVEAFAQSVAAMAESHGIERFEMTFRPDWGDDFKSRQSITGPLRITYWLKDGRGRPSRNIRISMEARLDLIVEESPESSS